MSSYLHCDAPGCVETVGPIDSDGDMPRGKGIGWISLRGYVEPPPVEEDEEDEDDRPQMMTPFGTFVGPKPMDESSQFTVNLCGWDCFEGWVVSRASLHREVSAIASGA